MPLKQFLSLTNHFRGDSGDLYVQVNTEVPFYLNKKQRELLEVIMHRVISLDPGFNFSGPYRFFGSLYTRIPGIELSQSKTYFDRRPPR